ncbi:MAG: hypothetical protein K6L81_06180, partial [Agarilytica sp.]
LGAPKNVSTFGGEYQGHQSESMKKLLIIITLISFSPSLLAEDVLIILGKVTSVSLYRNSIEDNVKKDGDFLIVSNACGRYTANLNVVDVIVGSYSKNNIEIHGTIGEWCDPRIPLQPDSYVVELRRSESGFEESGIITLYETDNGELAALPYMASSIGKSSIHPVNFAGYYARLYVSKAEANKEFWEQHDKSWFKDDEGALFFSKGIPYGVLKQAIASNKSINFAPLAPDS